MFFVRNITDVDDRIIARANELGVDAMVVADRYTRAYEDSMRALGVMPPDIAPRATGHIFDMQELISTLIDRGFAYPGEGSVYFAVEKLPTRRVLDIAIQIGVAWGCTPADDLSNSSARSSRCAATAALTTPSRAAASVASSDTALA